MIDPLGGFLPFRFFEREGEPRVDWCWFGGRRLLEPFFEHSVDGALRLPYARLFRQQTDLAGLVTRAGPHPGVPLAGLVFHMSRCGSTLVSQMLAALPTTVVVSEPAPLDALLRLPSAGEEEDASRLRALVAALGQPRAGGERHLVLKLDAWATLHLPRFRRAFPETPWVFVHRDPVEVVVSQLARRGIHTVPAFVPPELFGIRADELPGLSQPEYVARVIGAICRPAIDAVVRGEGVAIGYEALPGAVFDTIAPLFGIEPDEAGRRAMREASERSAKETGVPFVTDSDRKRREAGSDVIAAVRRWVAPETARLRPGGDLS